MNLEYKIDSDIALTKEERITYCRLLQTFRNIFIDNCENLDFKTVFSGGRIIAQSSKRKHCEKTDYLFKDKNKALIWARVHLGHDINRGQWAEFARHFNL